ncbi:MAG TPA: hypothetical protein VM347_15385 [Nonomuraea sp.]|nr:hypothetical protein [Nonomuraea sp.]
MLDGKVVLVPHDVTNRDQWVDARNVRYAGMFHGFFELGSQPKEAGAKVCATTNGQVG